MYTLKSIARRGTLLGAAFALLAAAILPAAPALADALNPLTERSLLLSSSAPGYQDTDGSGNSETAPNAAGENYAPPGSGPNGKKSGETFSFNVSTNSSPSGADRPIMAMTFQYCTRAAGLCQSPGNNTGDSRTPNRGADSFADKQSDLNVNLAGAVAGTNFDVYVNNVLDNNWDLDVDNKEDSGYVGSLTGKNNYITLTHTGAGAIPTTGQNIRVVFKATTSHFITNPGSGAFFVKINTYDSVTPGDHVSGGASNIDGGVTVANVMTDSIHITTKVLETMQFSVGTRNPDTTSRTLPTNHGTCEPVEVVNGNRLELGDQNAEFSLSTEEAYDVNSYWRLSSNSSGGATVYYSGNTLANTVGDEIRPIGPAAQASNTSTEQFGLAFSNAGTGTNGDVFPQSFQDAVALPDGGYKYPELEGLGGNSRTAAYRNGVGTITDGGTAQFAFEKESNTEPRVLTTDNSGVVSCATAKMRYLANIAANTPAGVYTTKINYLAAPQY